MKPLVSREIVEETVGVFNAASPEELDGLRAKCGPFQEEVTAFVIVYTEGLPNRERALVLAVYALMVEAFRRSGATFRRVRSGEVIHAWKSSAAFVRDLRSGRPAPATAEPEVLLLVLDMLLGENDPAGLDAEAAPFVAVRVLKTAADCVHRAGVLPAARR
ncbi:MAG TPA: hypothetical protein VGO40_10640 [Longimicrobium sp.]|nr:hypothetical protein [Longimicrobium sp.]